MIRSSQLAPDRLDLSLVFPVFDEEENVGPLLEAALRTGARLADRFEIICMIAGRGGVARGRDIQLRAHDGYLLRLAVLVSVLVALCRRAGAYRAEVELLEAQREGRGLGP